MPDPATAPAAFRLGDRGEVVSDIRDRLGRLDLLDDAAGSDEYDAAVERAVRAFQQQRGLSSDGIVGRATWRALDEASWRLGDRVLVHLPGTWQTGDDVITLQRRLLDLGFKTGRVDGRFGPVTERAVQEFQRNIGIPPDGTCGPATLKVLSRLAPLVKGGSPNAMRAEERIRREGPQLTGKVVVIDAATPEVEDPSLRELADSVTIDLARRVEGRLVATGVQAYLTRARPADSDDTTQVADFANRAGAHLCISLQVDASQHTSTRGVSTYYYGIEAHGIASWVGERFAGLLQREIVARTDLPDLRSHARSWEILRLTQMPAVCLEVGYVTNPEDAARLADPAFRDVVAEAIVVAVQRLYLAPESDPHTGVLRVDQIRALRSLPHP
jgi:N-acetylmuramoyl-L-alanine amidase